MNDAARRVAASAAVVLALAVAFPGGVGAAGGWTFQPIPGTPSGSQADGLYAISCTAAASCLAVGTDLNARPGERNVAEFWNGSTWSRHGIHGPSSYPPPQGVSCNSVASCMMVSDRPANGGSVAPLAEYWNGHAWTNTHAKSNGGEGSEILDTLSAVSCTSAANCMAVGSDGYGGSVFLTTEQWNGSEWTVDDPPNPGGAEFASFAGVSCVTAVDCTAVGYQEPGSVLETLAEHWDGSTWTVEATPSPGTELNQLNAISCTSASHCEATGFSSDSLDPNSGTALAESWNGSTWKVQATPVQAGATSSTLNGISCVTPANCTAVGSFTSASSTSALAEYWNGSTWAQQDTAPSTDNDQLNSVACRPGGFCSAVGTDTTEDEPIAESENG